MRKSEFKLTPRQERFVLLIVKGVPNGHAYEQAGYSATTREIATVAASKLLRNVNVMGRINELQEALRVRTVVTLDGLTNDLLDIKDKALVAGSFQAAVAATIAVARLHGFMVEKAELTVMHRPAPRPTKVLELTEDEWLRQFGTENRKRILAGANSVNRAIS